MSHIFCGEFVGGMFFSAVVFPSSEKRRTEIYLRKLREVVVGKNRESNFHKNLRTSRRQNNVVETSQDFCDKEVHTFLTEHTNDQNKSLEKIRGTKKNRRVGVTRKKSAAGNTEPEQEFLL